jgi:di/tripeptidase
LKDGGSIVVRDSVSTPSRKIRVTFESKEDESGNILIIKPSSRGMENRKLLFFKVTLTWSVRRMLIIRMTGRTIL